MKILCVNAILILVTSPASTIQAFIPSYKLQSTSHRFVSLERHSQVHDELLLRKFATIKRNQCRNNPQLSSLHMASDDFNEAKYTEAAWALVSSLTKVADYYQNTNVEAPLLLDLMLNPSKHNAGENAEAAKKVVEKALTTAGVDVSELRSELETHLSKQAKVKDSSNKIMGRSLQKVIDTARIGQAILGVSM